MGVRNEWVGKRQSVRQTCQMRAELRFLEGGKPVECVITDISASGARVELPPGFEAPEDFDLFIPSRNEIKFAKVRRVVDNSVGVAFLRSRLDDPLVMQSILDRLARLERGYGELKSGGLGGEHHLTDEDTGAVVDVAAALANVPKLDQRMTALARGLSALREDFDARGPADTTTYVDHGPAIVSLRDEMEALASKMEGMHEAAMRPLQALEEVSDIRTEMTRLHAVVRTLTANVGATGASASADHGADIISLRGEVAALASKVRDVAHDAAGAAPAEDLAHIRAEMTHLHQSVRTLTESVSATGSAPVDHGHDIVSLRGEVAALTQAVHDMTTVTAALPEPSEDLSAIRAEMEQLGVSMRAVVDEPPPAKAANPVRGDRRSQANEDVIRLHDIVEAEGLAKLQDLDQLKAAIAELRAGLAEIEAAPIATLDNKAELRGEIEDLRQSVRALVLLVAKSLNPPRQAA